MSTESDMTRTFPVTLTQHLDRDENDRPIYHFKLLSLRDRRECIDLLDRIDAYEKSMAEIAADGMADTTEINEETIACLKKMQSVEKTEGEAIILNSEALVQRLFAGWTRPESPSGEPVEGDWEASRHLDVFDEADLRDLVGSLYRESKIKAVDRKNSIARLTKNTEDAAPTDAKQPEA